ncbi:MAG: GNAT family N-acetyltransferase [Chloroflexi bacterium]|nr:GNAT family N-acetyltransferase [Chloroflexota bacterium]
MDKEKIRALENASRSAWRALEEIPVGGWVARFANGYTKRANSVNAFADADADIDANIATCEKLYAARNLPAIFRLTPLAPPSLDRALASRGYAKIEPSLTMNLDLRDWQSTASHIRELELDAWLAAFCALAQSPIAKHQAHREILRTITTPKFFAMIYKSEQPVACGLSVLTDAHLGLFDIVTDAHYRNQGYGFQLVAGLLHRAREHHATNAYLQVTQSNAPARHLYEKIGFQNAYEYWYRVTENKA